MSASPALENVEDVYPLTPLQEGMVFHAVVEPETAMHVGRIVCSFEGELDVQAFRQAWNDLLARHPALRSAFVWEGLDAPMQVVRRTLAMPFQHHDWTALAAGEAECKFDAWLWKAAVVGFDLTDAPLSRVDVFSFTPTTHRFVWACHHAVADGWSIGVALEELLTFTSGAGHTLLPPAPRYRNHIAWLLKRDALDDERFWRHYLKDFSQRTSIDLPRPSCPGATSERRHYSSRPIGVDALAPIAMAAKSMRVTLNTLFQAAWSLVLARYASTDDVVFGVVSSGRPDDVQGVERMVGLLVTTTPMRVRISDGDTVRTFLQRLQTDATGIRQHEQAPLTRIQSWSDVAPGEALFDCLYVFGNYPPQTQTPGAALRITSVDIKAPSTFPFALLVDPDGSGGLVVTAVTDPSRFHDESAGRIVDAVIKTAHALAFDLDASIEEIDCLPRAEGQILEGWGRGDELAIPCDDVVDTIEDVAAHAPNAIAVGGEGDELTYAALLGRARSTAQALMALGVEPGEPVIVQIERGPKAIVGILSVLLAGGAYVPLDPTYPKVQRARIVEDSKARFMMTAGEGGGTFDGLTVIDLDKVERQPGSTRPWPRISQDTPAYIIYTSGSSGRPKGVVVSRANLAFSNTARRAFYQDRPEAFLLLSSLAFDSSVVGLFWTLSTGGTLVVAEHRLEQDIERLADRIADHGVTHLLCLPSLYAVLIDHADPQKLTGLCHAIVAGEACPPGLSVRHRRALPRARLINEYGPTEASVWCAATDITDTPSTRTPSIGRPIPGVTIRLVDHRDRPTPMGAVGEIMIGGPGVATGYHGQSEMTAACFVRLPNGGERRFYRTGDYARWQTDGTLAFLGRRDGQLKIRGHRIEIGEVEAALEAVPSVQAAAIIPLSIERQVPRLVAFVEGEGGDADAVRLDLEGRLPDAMLPQAIEVMPALPRLANGKIDRFELRAIAENTVKHRGKHEHCPPTTPFEKTMAAVWEKVLKVDRVGTRDDFFALGGDSLASIRIVSLARRQGLTIRPTSVLEYPTIEALQHSIEREEEQARVLGKQDARLFFMVHGGGRMRDNLRDALGDGYHVHLFDDHWDDGCLDPTTSIQGMADAYLAELQGVSPHGPYLLGGYSIGAAVAIVMARRLMAAGEDVDLLFMLDPLDQLDYLGDVQGLDRETLSALSARAEPDDEAAATRPVARRLTERLIKAYRRYLRGPSRLLRGATAYYVGRPLSPKIASHYAWIVYSLAMRRYEPAPYSGRLLVFRSVLDRDPGEDYLWARLATGDYAEECFRSDHLALRRDPELVKLWTLRLADHLRRM